MKALSFHQPRAEQIMRGLKTMDVRTWQTAYRGPLAVHAAAERRDGRVRELGFEPDTLAYGALVGTVELSDIIPLDEATYEAHRAEHLLDAPFPGEPCYGWRFAHPRRFDPPLPYPGRRRLFEADVTQAFSPSPQAFDPDADAGQAFSPSARAKALPHAPQPDPERPFALYTIAENGGGYRVALYQWPMRNGEEGRRAPGALWSVELGGDPLRAVADHLLTALRANGYRPTDLARAAGSDTPFYLDELTGVRLALILMTVKPLVRHDRIESIAQGIRAMGDEEAYYWFSKCSVGPEATRAQKALRILLAGA